MKQQGYFSEQVTTKAKLIILHQEQRKKKDVNTP